MAHAGLSPQEYLRRLASGEAIDPISVTGMVKHDEGSPESISVALDSSCEKWMLIPLKLIESLEHLKSVKCKDHSHPIACIYFKDPPKDNTLALVFAELLRNQSTYVNTEDVRVNKQTYPPPRHCVEGWGKCVDGIQFWRDVDCTLDPDRSRPCVERPPPPPPPPRFIDVWITRGRFSTQYILNIQGRSFTRNGSVDVVARNQYGGIENSATPTAMPDGTFVLSLVMNCFEPTPTSLTVVAQDLARGGEANAFVDGPFCV